jgi:hypothetical protein
MYITTEQDYNSSLGSKKMVNIEEEHNNSHSSKCCPPTPISFLYWEIISNLFLFFSSCTLILSVSLGKKVKNVLCELEDPVFAVVKKFIEAMKREIKVFT